MRAEPQIHSKVQYDIIIIGGGLAGLTSAIHLSKFDFNILLIEKNAYPKHKVCGEYISNEVLPYLRFLEVDPFKLDAKKIDKFELSTRKNKIIQCKLPLGGFGISRYKIDHALAEKATANGVKILKDYVTDIHFMDDIFTIKTRNKESFTAKIVIGAYGKRSAIDIKLDRKFIKNKSPFLAVKTHVRGDFPEDLVALHNFEGGYCGASKVEDNSINLCYITTYKAFKKFKDVESFETNVIFKNKYLKAIFKNSQPVFTSPLTISQISFATKEPVDQHILMCGDTAGMIHPLCGNGMSMAIRSAQIASNLIIKYFREEIKTRTALEKTYISAWKKEFEIRLSVGHFIALLFSRNHLADIMMLIIRWFPGLLPRIIRFTHGKLMVAK